jgi:hypothetical protein
MDRSRSSFRSGAAAASRGTGAPCRRESTLQAHFQLALGPENFLVRGTCSAATAGVAPPGSPLGQSPMLGCLHASVPSSASDGRRQSMCGLHQRELLPPTATVGVPGKLWGLQLNRKLQGPFSEPRQRRRTSKEAGRRGVFGVRPALPRLRNCATVVAERRSRPRPAPHRRRPAFRRQPGTRASGPSEPVPEGLVPTRPSPTGLAPLATSVIAALGIWATPDGGLSASQGRLHRFTWTPRLMSRGS